MDDKLIVENEEGIALIYFNSPDRYNAFDIDVMSKFVNHILALAVDKSVKGIIISGKGKAFCTGADLRWATSYSPGISLAFHELSSRFHQAIVEIRNMKKPVIAAINGVAAGGGFSLALACDFRVMMKNAVLKQAYTSNGLSINGGGTATLLKLVGWSKAMEIATFDEPITAEQALRLGLINRIAEGDAMPEALSMMQTVISKSLNSFGWSKQLLNAALHNPFEKQLEFERIALSACGESKDGKEGMAAFLEKRKPSYGS